MAPTIRHRILLGLLAGLLALVGGTYPTDAVAADPVVTKDKVWEREKIPFRTVERKTPKLAKGVRKVVKRGRQGVRVKIVQITYHDGVEVKRKVVRNFVAKRPLKRVVLVGTRVDPEPEPQPEPEPEPSEDCDPNYTGCVPIASDVDCGGGSGNGPAYLWETVQVIGQDIYDLDADGDGWACE